MASQNKHIPKPQPVFETQPFQSAEETWFWFIAAQEARNDGSRFVAGKGLAIRPCEPLDILRVVDRLYRQRRLMRDHLLVLRYYGRRHMPPDRRRIKEMRAHKIWSEAMERMQVAFERKGIVVLADPKSWLDNEGRVAR